MLAPRTFRPVAAAAVAGALTLLGMSTSAEAAEKAGPLMLNLKPGFGVFFGDFSGAAFAIGPEVGYALDGENAYLSFDPQFQFGAGGGVFITLPASFQYDIELIDSLYLYPKIDLGVSLLTGGGSVLAFFNITPAAGIKYQVIDIFHIGGEVVSFPIYIGDLIGAEYQFLVNAGVDL
jgi:hypothetical protein